MASFVHLIDQRRLIGAGGSTISGKIYFYYTGTTVKAPIYNDAALLTPIANPVEVAAGEIIPLIFLDDNIQYRRVIEYSDGSVPDAQDPVGNIFSDGDIGLPVGSVIDFSGTAAPTGFIFCFGQEISRADYAELFTVIGTTYGVGNGTTTFNLPDYRGRVGAGKDNMGGVAAARLSTVVSGSVLGAVGGGETATISIAQLPSHGHPVTVTDPGHTHGVPVRGDGNAGSFIEDAGGGTLKTVTSNSNTTGITASAGNTGSGQGHNNVQPTIVVNKIIKTASVSFLSMLGVDLAEEAAKAVDAIELAGAAQIALATAEADRAELAALYAEEFGGPTYASTAAGVAATTVGQFFRVWNGDTPRTYTRYERTATTPFYAVASPLATTADLAASGGSALVGFKQAGTGAVGRTAQDKMREVVSVKDFGAVGDGITDDTAAIQAALSTSATGVFFPQGRYRIVDSLLDGTPILTSSTPNRFIYGPGILTVTNVAKVALSITGANTQVSLEVDGANNLGIAFTVSADNCQFKDCYIHDLNGFTNYSAIGVRVQFAGNDYTVAIDGNRFENFQAVGDGTAGNGAGMTRAVAMSATANITRKSVVSNNKCWKIEGEEGDALQVISSNGAGAYYDWPVEFINNNVDLFTRRGVKVQANKVKIQGNTFSNDRAVNPGNLQGVIDITQGADAVIVENILTTCKFCPQIKQVEPASGYSSIIIAGNVITGIGTETSSSLIAVQNGGSGHQVVGNTINCPNYTGTVFFLPSNVNAIISGNICNVNNTALYNLSSATGTRLFGNIQGPSGFNGVDVAAPTCAFDVLGGIKTSRDSVTAPDATDGNIYSGFYTPTLANTTNISASTAYECAYIRVGNVVTVSGRVDIDAVAATTDTVLRMTLPIASNFTAAGDAGGSGACLTAGSYGLGAISILANTATDGAEFRLQPPTIVNLSYTFSFTYRIK